MQALLYADLNKSKVSESLGGSDFNWPKLVQGDDITIGLRFTQSIGGEVVEVSRVVEQLKAIIGKDDARPEDGFYKLTIGDDPEADGVNTTALIRIGALPQDVQNAINALSGLGAIGCGVATVTARDGSLIITFADATEEVPISFPENTLFPVSFGRVQASERDGVWIHDLRFIQAAVAFTDTSARLVPAAPTIEALQDGGFSGDIEWNEVQKLVVPPAFRGTYQIRRGFAKTGLLSVQDGIEEIAEALKALADEDGEFLVTNPNVGSAHIEFKGSMSATDQDLLTVQVYDAPEGDLTFTLSLQSYELNTLLRRAAEVKLPLEIEAIVQDEFDPEITRKITLLRTEITVVRKIGWDELSTSQNIDWLNPPVSKSYIPFTPDQIITGQQHYQTTIGNGAATVFVINHNLDTEAVHVALRENQVNGDLLAQNEGYSVVINSADQITVTVVGTAPAAAALAVLITSAGPASAFQAHTHTIAQVVGLQTILDELGGNVELLLSLVPTGALASEGTTTGMIAQWTLPKIGELYPVRGGFEIESDIASIDRTKLPRESGLLAAVHDASVEALDIPIPVPDAALIGHVYQNQTGGTVLLPGGLGRKAVKLKDDEFATCDGRTWYRVEKFGSETSYYPTDFSRELFLFAVNDKQLRLKKTLHLEFGLELGVVKSNTRCHWVVVIEHGSFSEDAAPATTGKNLAAITWSSTPILEQQILVTPVPCTHVFGCQIIRQLVSAVDTITANCIRYGALEGGADAPATANFFLRGRLIRFDTENGETDPRGFVGIVGLKANMTGTESETLGIATIQ